MSGSAESVNSSLIIGPESATPGVMPATPPGYLVPVSNFTVTPDRPEFTPTSNTGSSEPRPTQLGKLTVKGSWTHECNPASMIPVNKAFFGGTRVVGGLAVAQPVYPQQFWLSTLPNWFAENRHSDVIQNELVNGMYLGSTTWKFMEQGFMEAVYNFAALLTDLKTSEQVTGTITDTTGYEPFNYIDKYVMLNGSIVGYLKSEEFTIDRKLIEQILQDQTHNTAQIGSNVPTFTGNISGAFVDGVFYGVAKTGLEASIVIWIPHLTGYGMLIELPSIRIKPASISTPTGGFCDVKASFSAYGRSTVGTPARVWSGYWTTATLPSLSTLTLVVGTSDGADETFTMTGSETTLDAVVTKINATAIRMRASVDRNPTETAAAGGNGGGVLRFETISKGVTSTITVNASSTADALLGFDNVAHTGLSGKSILITVFGPLSS